ncbi:MAG: ribosome maturation factor RimP [Lachnospiraceae bacterium]|nr:ribosome maturation factor RimP [Lachnospiraceae bacterium]
MPRNADYEAKTEALLTPIAVRLAVTIYDVEYIKEGSDYILRAYIDKEGGVTLNDCESVSRALSDALDEEDFIADAYILEVSSPGLGRQLKKDKHLDKSIGSEVLLKTYKPRGASLDSPGLSGKGKKGKKENKNKSEKNGKEFAGILKSFDSEKIIIETEGIETIFNRNEVAMIKLNW